MNQPAFFQHEDEGAIQPRQRHRVQGRFLRQAPEGLDAGVIAARLDHVGEVDDLIEGRHARSAYGMTSDRPQDGGVRDAVHLRQPTGPQGAVQ